jgi:hypothetical protein
MPDPAQSHFDRFLRPILASRFLTISAVIHLLIIVLFGGKVMFNKYVEPPDFQSSGDDTVSTDTPQAPPQPPPDATLPPTSTDPSTNAPPPPPAPSMMALATTNPTNTSFTVPMPAIEPPTISNDLTPSQPAQTFGQGPPTTLPGDLAGRGSGRDGIGQKYGEKPPAEGAVVRALRWLQQQQQTDGTWGSSRYKGGFTGLALLCFLGHGETPQSSKEFSVVVTNAINALVTEGNRNQGKLIFGKDFTDNNYTAYEHAICTYALCEAYTMTKDPRLEPLVREAIGYIVKGQRDDGGWTYKYDTTPDTPTEKEYKSDTSVSGWQIQALKAAHLTGIPGIEDIVHPVLENAMKNIDRVFNAQDGTYGYRKANDLYNGHGQRFHFLTGVGVLVKLFWLGRADRDIRAALKDIESKELSYTTPDCNLYAWYYDTQACFQAQGSAWDWWNARFQDMLTSQQSADGSWPPTGNAYEAGGFATNPAGDGPVYRTTLCCLMLEVFYRYLPTSQDGSLGNTEVQGL